MTKNKKCSDCKWFENYNGCPICGYIAEVYHLAVKANPEEGESCGNYDSIKKP